MVTAMAETDGTPSMSPPAWARLGGVADATTSLIEGALALSRVRTGIGEADWHDSHLRRLVEDVRAYPPAADATEAAANLRQVLAVRYGYRGAVEDYDDLQNADLIRVIDRRRGLPVALSVLYMHVGRAAGWELCGLNFPGHFLVRLEHAGSRVILDPFHGGSLRSAAELRGLLKAAIGSGEELAPRHYAPVSDQDVLLRLENNIKVRALRRGDLDAAADSLERMLAMAPAAGDLWREAGLVNARLNRDADAITALERYLDLSEDDGLMREAAMLLQRLKQRGS